VLFLALTMRVLHADTHGHTRVSVYVEPIRLDVEGRRAGFKVSSLGQYAIAASTNLLEGGVSPVKPLHKERGAYQIPITATAIEFKIGGSKEPVAAGSSESGINELPWLEPGTTSSAAAAAAAVTAAYTAANPRCTMTIPAVLPDQAHPQMQLIGAPDLAGFEGGFAVSNITECSRKCAEQVSADGWHRLACNAWTFVEADHSPKSGRAWCWLRGGRGNAVGKCGYTSATCDNRPAPATDWPCCQNGFTCPDPFIPPTDAAIAHLPSLKSDDILSAAAPPPPTCASWCAGHTGGWQQKCDYAACSLCPQCTNPAVPCLNESNPHFDCPAPCFCTTTINETLIVPYTNITFSSKYNLQLDLFLPLDRSSTRLRPCMVAVHGGGFSGGNRQSEGTWCRRLAARGYVCAAVSYRLHPGINPNKDPLEYLSVIMGATVDVRAAIRWLRANAEKYQIDKTRVGAIGASAGAMITAFLVTVPGEGDGGNPGYDSSVQVGVSFSGALLATEYFEIKPTTAPFLDMHGCKDSVVPYSAQSRPPLSYAYNGVSTHQEMLKRGANSSLISFAGRGHIGEAGGMSAAVNAHADEVWAFLALHLNLSKAVCPGRDQSD
jgi:dienelactone hydrolase